MFRRDARLSRLRDERVARLYSKSLLLRILFVILNDFWISKDDFGIKSKTEGELSVFRSEEKIQKRSRSNYRKGCQFLDIKHNTPLSTSIFCGQVFIFLWFLETREKVDTAPDFPFEPNVMCITTFGGSRSCRCRRSGRRPRSGAVHSRRSVPWLSAERIPG